MLLRRLLALATRRQTAAKELVLTARKAEILRMLEMGLSNRNIADHLGIAIHTVKNHVHSVFTRLGVSTRAELRHSPVPSDSPRGSAGTRPGGYR